MKKTLVVFGTRPEEIKLFPFTEYAGFTFLRVLQSKDLQQNLIKEDFVIDEDELEDFIKTCDENRIMVQGDTRTAMRAALFAFEAGKEVVHVEAGLRTGDLKDPFPEEGYRRMIDEIATYKFCSTPEAAANCNGVFVGQTGIDTLYRFCPERTDEDFFLLTFHRRENFDKAEKWFKIIDSYEGRIVFVVHPNPTSQKMKGLLKKRKDVEIVENLPYSEFLKLLASCSFVLTDSGGLQEEATSIRKPVVLLRDKSERSESDIYEPGATSKIIQHLK